MIGMARVTYVVPVYNTEAFVRRCDVSLMEQTYPNIDYVFVDNASKDKSLDVLRQVVAKYPKRHSDVTILFVGHETGTCKAWVSWAFFFVNCRGIILKLFCG